MPEICTFGRWRVPILYLDNHLLVVEKPPNLPAQADASGDPDLLTLLKGYIGRRFNKPGNVYLGLVHRLDRPVGGAMVFARTSKAASRLSAAFQTHAQERRYLAVLQGGPKGETALSHWLLWDAAAGQVRAVPEGTEGARSARLITRPLAHREGLTLSEVTLETGRKHQIRVQHAAAGWPLWGDNRYGHGRPGQQIALWAAVLGLKHPTREETLRFVSTPPMAAPWQIFAEDIERWKESGERS